MKAIVCEMCGSQDLVKQDGVYVCQNCGTKYSIEEAKKMMVEIDNTKKLSNLYERARKSLEVDDLEHAAEYYKEILDENPKDWEAYFYSYLGEFPSFTNAQAASVASKLSNTIPPAYDMALENCSAEEATERVVTITTKTTDRLVGIAATGASLLRQYEGGNILSPAGKVHCDLYSQIRPTAVGTIANCVVAFDPLDKKLEEIINNNQLVDKEKCKAALLYMRKSRYTISDMQFEPAAGTKERVIKAELIHEYAEKVHELDSSFEVPSIESKTNSSGGCYVATAIYGSYDCPQVWTLRRFRDYDLAETWYGRAFIRMYYAISPTLVKWFGHTEWFKRLFRGKLDRMVKRLQDKGFESTPYEDRNW
jgi:transcription elongation factor Elf1